MLNQIFTSRKAVIRDESTVLLELYLHMDSHIKTQLILDLLEDVNQKACSSKPLYAPISSPMEFSLPHSLHFNTMLACPLPPFSGEFS